MIARTTKAQFKLFEREVKHWVNKLGLWDWRVYVMHEDLGDDTVGARCGWKTSGRVASISLNSAAQAACGDEDIRRYALHECLELLMSGLTDIMWEARPVDTVDRETHKVIMTLENVLGGKR